MAVVAVAHSGWLTAAEQPTLRLDPAERITQYVLELWNLEDGLPSNRVLDIEQTADGYLWLATYDGLVRFDGAGFYRFHTGNTPAFTNNQIYSLEPRADGDLWIGGSDGSILLRSRHGFIRLKDPGSDAVNGVFSLHEDRSSRLWVLSERDGILIYAYQDDRLETLPLPPSLKDVSVPTPQVVRESFFEADDGAIWFASQGQGAWIIEEDSLRVLTTAEGLNDDFVQTVVGGDDGVVWIASRGLNRVRDGQIEDMTDALGLFGTPVPSLTVDQSGSLWIGERRLYRHSDLGTEQYEYEPFDLFPDPVLYQDTELSLWVGSVAGPLVRFRNGFITAVGAKEGLSGDLVHSVYEDSIGNLWVGTFDNGLNRLVGNEITHYTEADGLPSGRVVSIHETRDGRLWLGTLDGLVRYENGSFKVFTTADGLPSDRIRVVYGDPDEPATLWIGTVDAGLIRWRDGVVSSWTADDGLVLNNIRWVLKDRSGALWIGTDKGLNVRRDDELTTVTAPHPRTRCAFEDAEGTIWLGTAGGGLLRYKSGEFTSYTTREGLPGDEVWAIQEDDDGYLWLGGPGYFVARVNKAAFDDHDAGDALAVQVESFGGRDGLRGGLNAGGFPGSWKGADGTLWFSTREGVIAVAPDLVTPPSIPTVLVESVSIDGETVDPFDKVVLPPGTRRVAIRFSAPVLTRPDRVAYRYRLVGYDDQWVAAGDVRAAHFAQLPPRDFRFEVVAYDKGSGRSGQVAGISISAQPLWWQTWWFRVAALAGVLSMSWCVLWLRGRRAELRNLRLQQHRDELAHLNRVATMGELTAALGHELNQPLGAIRANAEAAGQLLSSPKPDLDTVRGVLDDIIGDDERAAEILQRIRNMVRRQPGSTEKLKIDSVIDGVLGLTRAEAVRRGVTIDVGIPPALPEVVGDRVQLQQVLLNLILNGVDAVEETPTPRLLVRAGVVDREFVGVSVRDNGKVGAEGGGLDSLFEPFYTTKPDSMGMGLAISRTIVDAHGGRIWAIENPECGLTVHFTVPIASS